jgi:hypothetical protein
VITALVLLNVQPGRVRPLAEELLAVEGVTECYSVAIAARPGILSTETLIAFRAFAKRDLGLLWDVGSE